MPASHRFLLVAYSFYYLLASIIIGLSQQTPRPADPADPVGIDWRRRSIYPVLLLRANSS